MSRLLPFFALLPAILPTAHSADWAQWRGPRHNNVADPGQNIPTQWGKSQHILWKTDVPGRGHSSPIVIGNLIILTSADEQGQQQGVFAYDRNTGKQQWATVVSKGGFPNVHRKNTHASATPCSDGQHIYATFCHHGKIEAIALGMKGAIQWRRDVGPFQPKAFEYGYGASPTLYRDSLIIVGDCDTSAWLKALNTTNGQILWQQERPLGGLNWSSPIVSKVAGKEQMLLSGATRIASYEPRTGQPLWNTPCLTMATCGTVVWDEDTIYASGGYPKKQTVAVKADGSGTILWQNKTKCYEQSMLFHNDYLYALDDNGIAFCWHGKTGREMWKERLRGPVSASPVLVGNTIYVSNELGTTFVYKANPEKFELLSRNQLGTESFATPTIVDSKIYIRAAAGQGNRRQDALYAVSQ